MAVDLKLVNHIMATRGKFSRYELVEKLKKEGYAEQDIIDSYDEVVKRGSTIVGALGVKSMAVTVILSLFWPGAGHMYTRAVGIGVLILCMYIFGIILNYTFFGMVIGIPLGLGMFIWGLVGSISRCGKINRGEI
ncbi:MAG: hypothetical protein NUV74_16440 [Candidatus Brocadiaceae bacterium]|nr:hypothetical protein [Candidatus Brocadiaceae bacterium]